MFWLFWTESLVLSFFDAVRVLYSQGQTEGTPPEQKPLVYHTGAALKFLFGRILIFLFYSLFIIVFIGFVADPKGDRIGVVQTIFFRNQLFNWALLLSMASQVFYLIKYFFMNGQYYYSTISNYAILFNGRQLVIHVAVVLGAVGATFLFKNKTSGSYAGIWIIGIFCFAKCIWELFLSSRQKTQPKQVVEM
jgi:Family of unknown function (DUF6498)